MVPEITLRDATQKDYPFLYDIHRDMLKEYIDCIWGWDEDWQIDYFRKKFDLTGRKIIHRNGIDVGYTFLDAVQPKESEFLNERNL
jgi:hypothetical protein